MGDLNQTIAGKIRNYEGLPSLVVAEKLGISASRVSNERWRDANRQRVRARNNHNTRLHCERRGIAPGQQTTVLDDKEIREAVRARVIQLRKAGVSQGDTASRLGLSLGQVAGIMHRHRKAREARS